MIKVTRDSNVNMNVLKKLKKAGLIDFVDVKTEVVPKATKKILPVGVYGYTKYGESIYAGEDCSYSEIIKIIGKNNIGDAVKIEAHIRSGNDYFITEDKGDILNYRSELEERFRIKILHTTELEKLCESVCTD